MENTIQVQRTAEANIRKEVKNAYADCWMGWNKGVKIRNLDFEASAPVSRLEAYHILSEAIPDGYNEFTAKLILDFPTSAVFIIAREGSVCLYVKGDGLPSREDLKADEYDSIHGGWTRIWWD